MTHSYLQNVFAERGCKLLTTEDEYIALKVNRKIPKVEYIASCGHKHAVHTNVFISRNSGIKCPACVAKDIGERKEGDNSRTVDGNSLCIALEDKCIDYVSQLLKDDFELVKNRDGCLSDFVIRPKGSDKNDWLRIQMKSTEKQHFKVYGFRLQRKYPDCVIICMCWEDKRMWVFDSDQSIPAELSIGHKTSKYDNCAIRVEKELSTRLQQAMTIKKLVTLETANIPISPFLKREQEFVSLREEKLHFLTFSYPTQQQLVYDFLVDGLRVQEKVANKKGTTISARFCRNNGRKLVRPYTVGECNLYWVHSPDKDTFWVIPESVLLKEGYISSDETVGKTNLVVSNKKFEDYKFTYSKLDKELLLKTIQTR